MSVDLMEENVDESEVCHELTEPPSNYTSSCFENWSIPNLYI